jgi:hypothetical protein
MIQTKRVVIILSMFAVVILLLATGCNKNDSTAQNKTFNLMVKDVLGVSGKVTFTETSSTSTTVDIVLSNAPSGTHPANLYMSSVVENGAVVAALNPVDETGKSSTVITTMTYSQLIVYAGSIKVFKSSSEPNLVLAQGDIGGNVLTTTNKTYTLTAMGIYGVTGTALFEKRENGNTLVTISLVGAIPGDEYPATINLGSIASVGGGPVVVLLKNANGTTGKSYTNIEKLDSGMKITYDNWLVYDGYINIYQTPVALENIICNGNIGSN